MPVYVCAESALQHYRIALRPARQEDAVQRFTTLRDAVSSLHDVRLLSLVGLGLPTPSIEEPLHVLVPDGTHRGRSKCVLPMVWSGRLPRGALRKVSHDAYVSSPEFLFLQMARKLDLIALIELGMELCGTYRRETEAGLTLYDQPALTTPRRIVRFLDDAGSAWGSDRARQAAKYLIPNSASPFETIVYLLLCLPRRLGGYNFPRPVLNSSIKFGKRGKQHTLRRSSSPDLFWRDAQVDLECHGKVHELEKTRLEDSMRRKALERMDVEVIELMYEEVSEPELFHATVRRLAKKIGVRVRSQSEDGFEEHRKALRDALFPAELTYGQLWDESIDATDEGANDFSWEGEEMPSEFDSWEVYMVPEQAPEL